ncbi:hypothetical protein Ae201684_017658 [Aphanomyces euteiches]|uniref:Uncharacterized protein n=1 Tax=Aphanomyces euteiches TaxID=100861 RepID=A0A6G0WB24_9STRA|nr:hypothetical protein Ae201684_017658 [Aphanomyces euteiches]
MKNYQGSWTIITLCALTFTLTRTLHGVDKTTQVQTIPKPIVSGPNDVDHVEIRLRLEERWIAKTFLTQTHHLDFALAEHFLENCLRFYSGLDATLAFTACSNIIAFKPINWKEIAWVFSSDVCSEANFKVDSRTNKKLRIQSHNIFNWIKANSQEVRPAARILSTASSKLTWNSSISRRLSKKSSNFLSARSVHSMPSLTYFPGACWTDWEFHNNGQCFGEMNTRRVAPVDSNSARTQLK